MQSILAESGPHRGRAIALAAAALLVLMVITAALGVRHAHRSHREHPRLHSFGRCGAATYYYLR